jgi:hypothetical protein
VAAVRALVVICLLGAAPATAAVLDFDSVPAGTVLDEAYAFMGVHIRANGTGLGDVIAAIPCESPVSPPNVLSYQPFGECPATRDESGWFVVDFDQPQNLVAITAMHRGPDTVAYLQAYGVDGFIDEAFTTPGANEVGVPQRMELTPPPDRPRITQVRFGVKRVGDSAVFDDLELDVVVPTAEAHWGTLKATWR